MPQFTFLLFNKRALTCAAFSLSLPLSLVLALDAVAPAAVVYSENFDGYTTGNIAGQNGWTAVGSNAKIQVGDAGGTDKVAAGESATTTGTTRNLGLFNFAANDSVVFTGRMRTRYQNITQFSVLDNSGDSIFTFGVGSTANNGYVVIADDGTLLHNGNLTGDNALSGTNGVNGTFEWFDFRFTVNLNGAGDATGTFEVDKDGGASELFQTIAANLDLGLTAAHEDTLTWKGAQLSMRFDGVQFNNLQVEAFSVPEPSSLPLFAMLGLGLAGWRLARRLRKSQAGI
jgi:hypothetical protein